MMDIARYLEEKGALVEHHLDHLVPLHRSHYENLYEAARYSLLGGGKRLRPILTLATTDMLKGDQDLALSPACTLELIHTYSLIHDDLPCMDDDDYRRGKPSVHKQYSEGHAVLTGDYLLTYAFEILADHPRLPAHTKVKLISLLAKRSGSNGMIGGQVMDLKYEGQKINLDTLKQLHRNKTGALISAAVEFGGILSDAADEEMIALREFGEQIGLAFQIIDDILDVTKSMAKHGRKISSDISNNKSTYVTLLGLDQSKAYALECYKKAVNALKIFSNRSLILANLAQFIINREN